MNGLQIAVLTIFKPADGFMEIKKNREHFSYFAPTVILIISILSSILRLFIVHYPLSTVNILDVNLFQQIFSFLLPFLIWVYGQYQVTCIFGGETKLREVYSATCFAFLPYAVFTLPVALFTNVLGIESSGLVSVIETIIAIWVALLILISIKEMNTYSIPTTLLVIFVSIIAVLFIAVIAVLLYVLGFKLYDFIVELIKEYGLFIFG